MSAASVVLGMGSTFTVRLRSADAAPAASAPVAGVQKVRVLVDENRDAADILSALLDLLG